MSAALERSADRGENGLGDHLDQGLHSPHGTRSLAVHRAPVRRRCRSGHLLRWRAAGRGAGSVGMACRATAALCPRRRRRRLWQEPPRLDDPQASGGDGMRGRPPLSARSRRRRLARSPPRPAAARSAGAGRGDPAVAEARGSAAREHAPGADDRDRHRRRRSCLRRGARGNHPARRRLRAALPPHASGVDDEP